jgi:hypothetical protein
MAGLTQRASNPIAEASVPHDDLSREWSDQGKVRGSPVGDSGEEMARIFPYLRGSRISGQAKWDFLRPVP